MNPLTLELRDVPSQAVDMSPLSSNLLTGQTTKDINSIKLWLGTQHVRVGELFAVSGEDLSHLIIRNAHPILDRIGAGLSQGTIEVDGDAGAYLGLKMRGGRIYVRGTCGEFCASRLSGGFIQVDGDVDDYLGAPLVGERQGMRGGMVLVKGNAGDRVGDCMRRGTILIEGTTGDYCCARMIAGTVAVLGDVGQSIGFGMRRGTLLLAREPAQYPATFVDAGAHNLGFLPLWARSLRGLNSPFAHLDAARQRVHRHIGDLACGGHGELLVWVRELPQMVTKDAAA